MTECSVCGRWFHPLGIMRHRTMHAEQAQKKTNLEKPEMEQLNG